MTFSECLKTGDFHISRAREAQNSGNLPVVADAALDAIVAILEALRVAQDAGVQG